MGGWRCRYGEEENEDLSQYDAEEDSTDTPILTPPLRAVKGILDYEIALRLITLITSTSRVVEQDPGGGAVVGARWLLGGGEGGFLHAVFFDQAGDGDGDPKTETVWEVSARVRLKRSVVAYADMRILIYIYKKE